MTAVLPRLRRRQLVDLARAYGIDIDPDGTRQQILPIMEAAEMRGTFNQPPKNSYYFHKAKYSSDQIKDAKAHGGFLRDQYGSYSVPCEILFQWKGADPEADRIKPHTRATIESGRNIQGNPGLAEYHELKRKAVALGVNTHEMTKDQLRAAIAAAEAGKNIPNEPVLTEDS